MSQFNIINRNTIRYYSSKPVQQCEEPNLIMDPRFLTGFVDALSPPEGGCGCFTLGFFNKHSKFGWTVQLFFQIALHQKDISILEQIKPILV